MTTFIPQPYPLFLATTESAQSSIEVDRVVAWYVADDDPNVDLLPVTLAGPYTPGANVEPDASGRVFAYGHTEEEAGAGAARAIREATR